MQTTQTPVVSTAIVRRAARTRHLPLAAILLAFIALSLTFNFRTPRWEANDEFDHTIYVEQMARAWRAPPIDVSYGHESHQPPLAYGLYAVWQRMLGIEPFEPTLRGPADAARHRQVAHDYTPAERAQARWVHELRLFSTFEGVIVILGVFGFATAVTKRRDVALAAAAIAGTWPKMLVLSSTINNDIAAIAACTLAIVGLVRMLDASDRRARTVRAVWLGLACGVCALTKYTTLPIIAAVFGVMVVSAVRRREVRAPIVAGAVAVAGSAWWFIGNITRYGDPLARARTLAYLKVAFHGHLVHVVSWFNADRFLDFVPRTIVRTFIYDGGWNQLLLPGAFNALLTCAILAAAIFGCILARRAVRARNASIIIGSIAASFVAVLIIAKDTTQAEGRYLLAALPAFAVAMLIPVLRAPDPRVQRGVLVVWPALFVALDIYILLIVMRGFAGL
ncbi:MAG: DUF2142 domain-containing protein [Actinomycetota bacterium]